MNTKELKFNSQICTTKEQSQRLLDLGLKPETADMYHTTFYRDNIGYEIIQVRNERLPLLSQEVPAWSLHRLFDIMYVHCHELKACENVYDAMIKRIEKTIEHNTHNEYYFNKNT